MMNSPIFKRSLMSQQEVSEQQWFNSLRIHQFSMRLNKHHNHLLVKSKVKIYPSPEIQHTKQASRILQRKTKGGFLERKVILKKDRLVSSMLMNTSILPRKVK